MNINEIKWTEELLQYLIMSSYHSNLPSEIVLRKFINENFPPKTYTEEEVLAREEAAWLAARQTIPESWERQLFYIDIHDWRNQKPKP